MAHLETADVWQELLPLLDRHPLTELADEFDVEVPEIVAALKRTETARRPVKRGEEAEAKQRPKREPDSDLPPEKGAVLPPPRPGSKDAEIAEHAHLLGQIPDGEVAEKAGVSQRTVANYRSRHGIAAYRRGGSKPSAANESSNKRPGRRSKVEPYRHLLGDVPDREIADKAGLTAAAVRSYRHRHGIPGPGRGASGTAPAEKEPAKQHTSEKAAVSTSGYAWRVRFAAGDEAHERVVVAPDVSDAAGKAAKAGFGAVVGLERLDPVLR